MSRDRFFNRTLLYVLLFIVIGFAIFPFFWMLSTAFKSQAEVITTPPKLIPSALNWGSFIYMWNDGNVFVYFFNSMKVAGFTTGFTMIIAISAAIGFSRFTFPFRDKIKILFLVSQLFPLVLLVTPYYHIMKKLMILDTHTSLVLSYVSFVLPFSVWMLTNYFNNIMHQLEEAAMVDGCTRIEAVLKITLPLAAPGIVATTINAFILAWNEFIFAQTFIDSPGMRTLPIGLRAFMGQYLTQWNLLMAGAVITIIPVIILFIILQKYLIQGLTAGGVKG